ncbi:MAG: hypothetical protein HY695_18740, partial [Deltaproteobacteria bacterium]|nr:hypothetical protein [Deltaproteobacteria bacterium]
CSSLIGVSFLCLFHQAAFRFRFTKGYAYLFLISTLFDYSSGRGATSVWYDGFPKRTFEWQAGSLFSPPLNAWHEHYNGSGETPARYVAVTSSPQMINLFHDTE